MHIDALLLLLFKRFSAASQTKYNFFGIFDFFQKKKYDKNTPVSPILVVIRVNKFKKGEQVKNTIATSYESVRKLL
jgi:hypothetical protein